MSEKIYVNSQFGELARGGMFDRNLVLLVQHQSNKIEEGFYDELISNVNHNHPPWFRFYNFSNQKFSVEEGAENVKSALDLLGESDFDSFVLVGKFTGALQALKAAKENDKVKGLVLVNAGDDGVDYDQLKEELKGFEKSVLFVQAQKDEKSNPDKIEELAAIMGNASVDMIPDADHNFSFIRDYRRMYRSVIEYVIENV